MNISLAKTTFLVLNLLLLVTLASAQNGKLSDASVARNLSGQKEYYAIPENNGVVPISYINADVLKNFKRQYGREQVRWYEQTNIFIALFSKDGRQMQVVFNRNGDLEYEIARGTEKDLPADLKEALNEKFPKYSVGTVSEIKTHGFTAWYLDIRYSNKLAMIKYMNGDIVETKIYNYQ